MQFINYKRFLKFSFVGIVNTFTDLIILNFLFFLFGHQKHSFILIIYNTISFLLANILSYHLNKNFTFKRNANYLVFLTFSSFILILNNILIYIFYNYFFTFLESFINLNTSKLLAILISSIFSFLINDKYIFKL
ncbi:MAG: GtrA family protein [archaeon]